MAGFYSEIPMSLTPTQAPTSPIEDHRVTQLRSPKPSPSTIASVPKFTTPTKLGNDAIPVPFKSTLPTSQIEISISARNLLNADLTSKSDPFCIVKMRDHRGFFVEVGNTEIIDDNLNPEWVKKVVVDYSFETEQELRFEVWDYDPDGQDFLGEFETSLAEIVSSPHTQFVGKLTGIPKKDCGELILVSEEVSSCKKIIHMQFEASNLRRRSLFVRNDPFLVFSRSNEDGSFSRVFKTMVDQTHNPRWNPIKIHSRTLCNGDFQRTIKIDCYDQRANGGHKLIGTCYTSMTTLSKGPGEENQFILHREGKNKHDCGRLALVFVNITVEVSFLDYILGGTQMHFAVAIDFTASNKAANDPQSLHYISSERPNHYETAVRSIGDIIQHYSSDKLFPAFGFGAKLANGVVSHHFPLNGDSDYPYCEGVEGILNHYRNCLQTLEFFGPTNFAFVIDNTISIANKFQDGKHYFVLLIITDGIISDLPDTKEAIIAASKLPISIIIVGVGDASFRKMDELDSDGRKLRVGNIVAERDIVQFVPMNKFLAKEDSTAGPEVQSMADLAHEVLAEIPAQMTGYMKSKNFAPQAKQPNILHNWRQF